SRYRGCAARPPDHCGIKWSSTYRDMGRSVWSRPTSNSLRTLAPPSGYHTVLPQPGCRESPCCSKRLPAVGAAGATRLAAAAMTEDRGPWLRRNRRYPRPRPSHPPITLRQPLWPGLVAVCAWAEDDSAAATDAMTLSGVSSFRSDCRKVHCDRPVNGRSRTLSAIARLNSGCTVTGSQVHL